MMGWSVGYDENWKRDIGYGVPSICDHPDCTEEIHRGLAYVCGGHPYGGEDGCGLFFCEDHRVMSEFGDHHDVCERCRTHRDPYEPTPDTTEWIQHKNTDPSWEQWRWQRQILDDEGDQ